MADSARRAHTLARLFATACGCALVVYACAQLAPAAAALTATAAFAIAYAAVSLEILALAWAAPEARIHAREALLGSGAALLIVLALHHAAPPALAGPAALLTVALGAGACLLGGWLGAGIEKPGQLVAVALVSGTADLWSVFDPGAPSARLAEQALTEPERLAVFALPFPLFGSELIAAVIGAGDVLFVALYVAAFRRHGLATGRLFVALALAFAAGLLLLLVLLRPLPLLPLLGAAAVASDRAARSLSGREWRTVAAVCVALLVSVALLRTR